MSPVELVICVKAWGKQLRHWLNSTGCTSGEMKEHIKD